MQAKTETIIKPAFDIPDANRIRSIDFTRGLVMVIMALDHTRDLMHVSSLTQNPTDLATTTPILFFTRWITHLCAPIFVFLSGTSAYLSFQNKKDAAQSKRFLLTRGLWLIVLEFTVINFGLWYDLHFRMLIFQVIAAIGFGFIILALLLKLSSGTIGIIGLVIISCHNLLQGVSLGKGSTLQIISSALFSPNAFQVSPNFIFIMGYPIIPWLGIMLTGFAAGKFFMLSNEKRKSFFLKTGCIALALFTVLRFADFYGDPSKWSVQKNTLFTFLSFINTTKYPPSLLYSLMTLGSMFLILYFSDRVKNKFTDIVSVYGKVPLFYYLVHWYIIHTTMLAMVFLEGFHWSDLVFGSFNFGRPAKGSGVHLGTIYLIWFVIVMLLYPLCKAYGKYKATHTKNKWLRYL